MRTIKFRGKTLADKKWVQGSLVVCNNGRHFITELLAVDEDSWLYWEVDPETVGQFVGLLDADGEEVYEGDIVLHPRYDDCGIVMYMDMGFVIKSIDDKTGNPYYYSFSDSKIFNRKPKVIGNIYDNPELLK